LTSRVQSEAQGEKPATKKKRKPKEKREEGGDGPLQVRIGAGALITLGTEGSAEEKKAQKEFKSGGGR